MELGALDRTTLKDLRKLLASIYPADGDQRRIATDAGLTVAAIQLSSSAFNNWHEVLHHANHNRRVERLLEIALEEFPHNEQLRAFSEGRRPKVLDGGPFDWHGPKNSRGLLERLVSGKQSLVDVSHLALGVQRARAVGKIVLTDGSSGTGFLISTDQLLLTNHHVLPGPGVAAEATILFNYQHSVEGHDEVAESFALAPEVFFRTSVEDDWTVVAVRGTPCERWGMLELRARSIKPGDFVNIIQHPGGGPKQVSLSFDMIAYVGDGRVQYLTDTLPGSSGAPVFDRHWNVVALHHSGGWLIEPGSPEQRAYYRNEGIRVERILEGLQR